MASKILIVEDEPDIVELLAYHLNQAGFETEAVTNGRDALNQMRANPPNLILLDLLLPEVDGLEVCRLLKQDASTADVPVIILTAKGKKSIASLGSNWELMIILRSLLARGRSY